MPGDSGACPGGACCPVSKHQRTLPLYYSVNILLIIRRAPDALPVLTCAFFLVMNDVMCYVVSFQPERLAVEAKARFVQKHRKGTHVGMAAAVLGAEITMTMMSTAMIPTAMIDHGWMDVGCARDEDGAAQ